MSISKVCQQIRRMDAPSLSNLRAPWQAQVSKKHVQLSHSCLDQDGIAPQQDQALIVHDPARRTFFLLKWKKQRPARVGP